MNIQSFLKFLHEWMDIEWWSRLYVKRIPLFPVITSDGYLVWLWPCWRALEGGGDDWGHTWLLKKPPPEDRLYPNGKGH